MQRSLRLAYFAHSLQSDWNNGNAHFLRGLLRALGSSGVQVSAFEQSGAWSVENVRTEARGARSLQGFAETFSDINLQVYSTDDPHELWVERLQSIDVVILHEWNPVSLAELLLELRQDLGFTLLFHDTHHRASSSPEAFSQLRLSEFDGVLAFGKALEDVYRQRFGIRNVWTFHEAADVTNFHPIQAIEREPLIVWIGNWGDDERSKEIVEYLLQPARALAPEFKTRIYGVRYPAEGLAGLEHYGVEYAGYLPNLNAPSIYAGARLTVHVPRQQYSQVIKGIPTIRVFEALACGIPLVSAPWEDSEQLFRKKDFAMAQSPEEMFTLMQRLLRDVQLAEAQAECGLETILARHTCCHRAQQLIEICEELRP